MSEMVERVARAIAQASMHGWDEHMGDEAARVLARAAIAAMREPSSFMLIVANKYQKDFGEHLMRDEIIELWNVMIGEALK